MHAKEKAWTERRQQMLVVVIRKIYWALLGQLKTLCGISGRPSKIAVQVSQIVKVAGYPSSAVAHMRRTKRIGNGK
jgi:hypothetical protein